MTTDFEYLVRKYGKPAGAVTVTNSRIDDLRGKLPNSLLDFWTNLGIGMWLDGLLQFCDPISMSAIVSDIFHDDAELSPDKVFVYAYSAFSKLLCWHPSVGSIKIDLVFCAVNTNIPSSDNEREVHSKLGPDRIIAIDMMNVGRSEDISDFRGAKLFERARDTLGVLQSGECYGFFPAIKLGGAVELKGLRRVRALEHFSILSGLDSFICYNVEDGVEQPGRRIGPG